MMAFSFLRISTFFAILSIAQCTIFTVYEDFGRSSIPKILFWGGGASQQFTVEEDACINLNFYSNKISSIDPHGGCIKIWEYGSCSGASMIVTDRSGCSKDLRACDISSNITDDGENRVTWDNKISSISSCSRAEEAQANRLIDNGDLKQYDMQLVNSNNAKTVNGNLLPNTLSLPRYRRSCCFIVKLCKHTDCKRQERIVVQDEKDKCLNFGGDWDRKVSSLYTYYDCVELYDGRNCSGESIRFQRSLLGPQDSCATDLSRCGWNNRIRSMRSCVIFRRQ